MKLALTLVSCLSLAAVGCDKKKSDAPAKPAPAAPAPGSAAAPTPPPTPTPTPGSAAAPGSGSAAPTPVTADVPADGIKLPYTPRQVGDKVTETEERNMVAKAELGPGQVIDFSSTEKRVEAKETLEVVDGAISKLKVTYTAFTIDETVGGKPKAKPTPTAGKTYVVWREGDAVKVTYEGGTEPPAEEVKAVTKGNRKVGKPDVLDKFLAGQAWKVGVKVDLPADVLAAMIPTGGDGAEPALSAMSLTLQSVDDAVATFAMTMASKSPGGEMVFELAGTTKVDRKTGRPIDVSATGPFTANAKVKLTGTMTMKTSYAR